MFGKLNDSTSGSNNSSNNSKERDRYETKVKDEKKYTRKPVSFALTPKSPTLTTSSAVEFKETKIIPTERVYDERDALYQRRVPPPPPIIAGGLSSKYSDIKNELDHLKIKTSNKTSTFDVLKSPPLSEDDIQGLLEESIDSSLDAKDIDELKTMRERIVSLVEKETKVNEKNKKSSKSDRERDRDRERESEPVRLAFKYPRHKKSDVKKDDGYNLSPLYSDPILSPPPACLAPGLLSQKTPGIIERKIEVKAESIYPNMMSAFPHQHPIAMNYSGIDSRFMSNPQAMPNALPFMNGMHPALPNPVPPPIPATANTNTPAVVDPRLRRAQQASVASDVQSVYAPPQPQSQNPFQMSNISQPLISPNLNPSIAPNSGIKPLMSLNLQPPSSTNTFAVPLGTNLTTGTHYSITNPQIDLQYNDPYKIDDSSRFSHLNDNADRQLYEKSKKLNETQIHTTQANSTQPAVSPSGNSFIDDKINEIRNGIIQGNLPKLPRLSRFDAPKPVAAALNKSTKPLDVNKAKEEVKQKLLSFQKKNQAADANKTVSTTKFDNLYRTSTFGTKPTDANSSNARFKIPKIKSPTSVDYETISDESDKEIDKNKSNQKKGESLNKVVKPKVQPQQQASKGIINNKWLPTPNDTDKDNDVIIIDKDDKPSKMKYKEMIARPRNINETMSTKKDKELIARPRDINAPIVEVKSDDDDVTIIDVSDGPIVIDDDDDEKTPEKNKKRSRRKSKTDETEIKTEVKNKSDDKDQLAKNSSANDKDGPNEPEKKEEITKEWLEEFLLKLFNPGNMPTENLLTMLSKILDENKFAAVKSILERPSEEKETPSDTSEKDPAASSSSLEKDSTTTDEQSSSTTKPKAKPKKNELEKLNEDIRNMFICQGVLTSNGRRMCTIMNEEKEKNEKSKSPVKGKATSVDREQSSEKSMSKKKVRKSKTKSRGGRAPKRSTRATAPIAPSAELENISSTEEISPEENFDDDDDDEEEDVITPRITRTSLLRQRLADTPSPSPSLDEKETSVEKIVTKSVKLTAPPKLVDYSSLSEDDDIDEILSMRSKTVQTKKKPNKRKSDEKSKEIEKSESKVNDKENEKLDDKIIKSTDKIKLQSKKDDATTKVKDVKEKVEIKTKKSEIEEKADEVTKSVEKDERKEPLKVAIKPGPKSKKQEKVEKKKIEKLDEIEMKEVEISKEDEKIKSNEVKRKIEEKSKENEKKPDEKTNEVGNEIEDEEKTIEKPKGTSKKSKAPSRERSVDSSKSDKLSTPTKPPPPIKRGRWPKRDTSKEKSPKLDEIESFKNIDLNDYFGNENIKKCKFCKYSGPWFVPHYFTKHPESECFVSRLKPDIADQIKAKKFRTGVRKRSDLDNSLIIEFQCYFCDKNMKFNQEYWVQHLATHTAEYRFHCPKCMATNKSHTLCRKCNVKTVAKNTKKFAGLTYDAYMCSGCNFVQTHREAVQNHIEIQHDNDKDLEIIEFNIVSSVEEKDVVDEVEPDLDMSSYIMERTNLAALFDNDEASNSTTSEMDNAAKKSLMDTLTVPQVSSAESIADRLSQRFQEKPEISTKIDESLTDILTIKQEQEECIDDNNVTIEPEIETSQSPQPGTSGEGIAVNDSESEDFSDNDDWEDMESSGTEIDENDNTDLAQIARLESHQNKGLSDTLQRLINTVQQDKSKKRANENPKSTQQAKKQRVDFRELLRRKEQTNDARAKTPPLDITTVPANANNVIVPKQEILDDQITVKQEITCNIESSPEKQQQVEGITSYFKIQNIACNKKEISSGDIIDYLCLFEGCNFKSQTNENLLDHLKTTHSNETWEGYCYTCEAQITTTENTSLHREFNHLLQIHLKMQIIDLDTSNAPRPILSFRRLSGDKLSSATTLIPDHHQQGGNINTQPQLTADSLVPEYPRQVGPIQIYQLPLNTTITPISQISPTNSLTLKPISVQKMGIISTTAASITATSASSIINTSTMTSAPSIPKPVFNITQLPPNVKIAQVLPAMKSLAQISATNSLMSTNNKIMTVPKLLKISSVAENSSIHTSTTPLSIPKTAGIQIQKSHSSSLSELSNALNGSPIKPWTLCENLKTKQIYEEMLKECNLDKFFKCMAATCSFCTHNRSDFLEHIKSHELFVEDQLLTNASNSMDTTSWLECSYCDMVADSCNDLVAHLTHEHMNCIYQCGHCFYRSMMASHIVTHRTLHHKELPLSVIVSDKTATKIDVNFEELLMCQKANVKPLKCYGKLNICNSLLIKL